MKFYRPLAPMILCLCLLASCFNINGCINLNGCQINLGDSEEQLTEEGDRPTIEPFVRYIFGWNE